MRMFKFYDAVKNDFAIALFYEKDLARVEYINQGRAMDPKDKIEFEAKIQHNSENAKHANKEGFIYWWEKYGIKMSMVTKNGFKFYCEEITQPTLLINAVTNALTELIDYEHTDQVLKVISNNFRTVLKQFHKSSMEKREITEKPKEEMVIKKW